MKYKLKNFIALTFLLFLIAFTSLGCFSKQQPYILHDDINNIEQISIVQIHEGYSYSILKTIPDTGINYFLTLFNDIKFDRFIFGDPTSLTIGEPAILFKYKNGDCEFVSYYAQKIIIAKANDWFSGRVHCDKSIFFNFLDFVSNNI